MMRASLGPGTAPAVAPEWGVPPARVPEFTATPGGFVHVSKRNCSASPAACGAALGLLAAVSLAIAAGFAAQGAWLVLPFAGIEIACVAFAFWLCGRHAGDREIIELDGEALRVTRVVLGRPRTTVLAARHVRVALKGPEHSPLLVLEDGSARAEAGVHLDVATRRALAAALRARITGNQ